MCNLLRMGGQGENYPTKWIWVNRELIEIKATMAKDVCMSPSNLPVPCCISKERWPIDETSEEFGQGAWM